jgi:hypothetical protein
MGGAAVVVVALALYLWPSLESPADQLDYMAEYDCRAVGPASPWWVVAPTVDVRLRCDLHCDDYEGDLIRFRRDLGGWERTSDVFTPVGGCLVN